MKHDFYFSQKQADLFRSINKHGGEDTPRIDIHKFGDSRYGYTSNTKKLIKVNRINGKEYTTCCDSGKGHGCAWDDLVLVDTDFINKITIGPDTYPSESIKLDLDKNGI